LALKSDAAAEKSKDQLSRDFPGRSIFDFCNNIGRKADVEIGSRGSEMDVTDVVRFLRERCPKLDVGGEAIGEFLRSGSTALRISDGVR
jgi:hypothetical protein